MFGKPKKVKFSKKEQKFIDKLNGLLNDNDVFESEKEYLQKAKTLFEAGTYFPNVVHRMEVTFRPLAVQQKLSPKMVSFYTEFPKILLATLPLGSNPTMLQGLPL
ncbi:bacteriocin immunity protein [Lactococcus nasutitermitis]|uniref:Bacteriocin immunity protein n=1 Tax=Lactococcus nasutitermitis TaxID=1652957 RepID=A0ABV9JCA4_9LACT|nr:bacteriocin immunity protein [Lactococcus nasutitermitis]